jgi:hypothetical protein
MKFDRNVLRTSRWFKKYNNMTTTKSISINCPVEKAFDFVANAANWPQFAIHNVFSIQLAENGYWLMETPRGEGKLKIHPQKQYGLLDHEFLDKGEGKWVVPARVVSTPEGCHLMMTFSKPPELPAQLFEEGMKLLEEEFLTLKKILEQE